METPTEVKVGGHVFTPVIFGKGQLHKLSRREDLFVKKLLSTGGNIAMAAQEIGISLEAAKRYVKRAPIKKYLGDMLERAARANGLTIQKLMAKIDALIEGELELTKEQLEGVKIAAKILRPAGTQVNVQVNQQNNVFGNSPYAGMNAEQLVAANHARLKEIDALNRRAPSQP